MADRDAAAFDRVMAAYRLPKGTEEERAARLAALQEALEGAAEVPLMVARRAVYVMGLAGEVTVTGNPNAASDGLSGAAGLYAASLSALANVRINAFAFTDAARREELLDDCRRLRDRADALLAEADEAFQARTS
jgi:glutamate formiminotransferase/formiminotetrahydrofolate cyclodeaminase